MQGVRSWELSVCTWCSIEVHSHVYVTRDVSTRRRVTFGCSVGPLKTGWGGWDCHHWTSLEVMIVVDELVARSGDKQTQLFVD